MFPRALPPKCCGRTGLGSIDIKSERQLPTSVPFWTGCFYAGTGSDPSTSEVNQLEAPTSRQ